MELKKSYKMRKAIEGLVNKYGFKESEITYGIEAIPCNRNEGYYDYATLHCPTTGLHFCVAYDGTIGKF